MGISHKRKRRDDGGEPEGGPGDAVTDMPAVERLDAVQQRLEDALRKKAGNFSPSSSRAAMATAPAADIQASQACGGSVDRCAAAAARGATSPR